VAPFRDGYGVFMGVARNTVRLSDFSGIIDPTGVRRSGQFFILNRYGTVVYSTEGVEVTLDDGGIMEGDNFLHTDNTRFAAWA